MFDEPTSVRARPLMPTLNVQMEMAAYVMVKTKARIKTLICPELKNRIDFHVTRYREATHYGTEAVITVDRGKVFGGGHYHRFVPECIELYSRVPDIKSVPRPEIQAICQQISRSTR